MEGKQLKTKMRAEFSSVNEDIMLRIFSKLPALSFASAACVSKTWNKVCSHILSGPKLASALSLNPSLQVAVKEVVDKVLSKPIRPHFVIACIGKHFSLDWTHHLLTKKFGKRVPVITNVARGIIGADAASNKLKEVKWEDGNPEDRVNRGIVLVVGFVPGLKVGTVPLLRSVQAPHVSLAPRFVNDIKRYTVSVSDSAAPAAIILFGDQNIDLKSVLAMMDYAIPEETVIVGDPSCRFLCGRGSSYQRRLANVFFLDAVALVFARDRNKPHGIGETQFHVALSAGVMPFGPQLKAMSVVTQGANSSWVTARMEGQGNILAGAELLQDIKDHLNDGEEKPDIYIGVTKDSQFPNGPAHSRSGSLAFYEVVGGDRQYLVINGVGVNPGDSFLFYHSDTETAASTCSNAFKELSILKEEIETKTPVPLTDAYGNDNENKVFGGLIFSCHLRGEPFFGRPNVDSSPFCNNFPGVPLAGMFCKAEIGRGCVKFTSNNGEEQGEGGGGGYEEEDEPRCCVHVRSSVYLAMSYATAA